MRNVVIRKKSPLTKLYLLPPIIKLLIALGLLIVICTVGVLILKQQSKTELEQAKNKKEQLEKEVISKSRSYGELVYYSKNTAVAKKQYDALLKTFPPGSKIDTLLSDITKLGTEGGLKFVSFRPQPEVVKKYYAAVPVEIDLVGSFHQLALFLSGIANLPGSVVGVDKFKLEHSKDGMLTLNLVATLYHTLPNSPEVTV